MENKTNLPKGNFSEEEILQLLEKGKGKGKSNKNNSIKIEKVKISEVKSNPSNPRIIKDHKFKKLVKKYSGVPRNVRD